MRYLLEFFQPTYGKALNRFIHEFVRLQDLLGEFQDACVAIRRLREYGCHVPLQSQCRGELIALGQLIGVRHRQRDELRARFDEVWSQFDQPGRRKQFLGLLK